MPVDVAEGAAGEPGTVAAEVGASEAQVQTSGEAAPPSADEAFYEKLRGMDPTSLPQDIRQKLEDPFLRQYSRKVSDLNDRQTRALDAIVGQLGKAGVTPSPDQRAALEEKIRQGDFDQLGKFVDTSIQQQVGPLMETLLKDRAIQAAERLHPYVKEREGQIAEVVRSRPDLQAMISSDGYRNAPIVLQAIAQDIERQELAAKVRTLEAENAGLKKGRSSSLPAQTSRAGSTQTASGAPRVSSLRDAMRVAAQQAGLPMPETE